MSYKEKRAHSRIAKKVKIGLSEDSIALETETRNISVSGINCQVKSDIPIMTRLKMQLELPFEPDPRTIKCSGVVVRCVKASGKSRSPMHDVAIFIDDISESNLETLRDFVATCC